MSETPSTFIVHTATLGITVEALAEKGTVIFDALRRFEGPVVLTTHEQDEGKVFCPNLDPETCGVHLAGEPRT